MAIILANVNWRLIWKMRCNGKLGQTQRGDFFKGYRQRSRHSESREERSTLPKSRQSCFSLTPKQPQKWGCSWGEHWVRRSMSQCPSLCPPRPLYPGSSGLGPSTTSSDPRCDSESYREEGLARCSWAGSQLSLMGLWFPGLCQTLSWPELPKENKVVTHLPGMSLYRPWASFKAHHEGCEGLSLRSTHSEPMSSPSSCCHWCLSSHCMT